MSFEASCGSCSLRKKRPHPPGGSLGCTGRQLVDFAGYCRLSMTQWRSGRMNWCPWCVQVNVHLRVSVVSSVPGMVSVYYMVNSIPH